MQKAVFLVDDDQDDREIFMEALAQVDNRYVFLSAEDGEDALQQLRAGLVPSYIILDLNMPRMDGRECLMGIKGMKLLEKTPVIIYSTSSYIRDREELLNLGADKFITKPSNFKDLCSTLEDALRFPG